MLKPCHRLKCAFKFTKNSGNSLLGVTCRLIVLIIVLYPFLYYSPCSVFSKRAGQRQSTDLHTRLYLSRKGQERTIHIYHLLLLKPFSNPFALTSQRRSCAKTVYLWSYYASGKKKLNFRILVLWWCFLSNNSLKNRKETERNTASISELTPTVGLDVF